MPVKQLAGTPLRLYGPQHVPTALTDNLLEGIWPFEIHLPSEDRANCLTVWLRQSRRPSIRITPGELYEADAVRQPVVQWLAGRFRDWDFQRGQAERECSCR